MFHNENVYLLLWEMQRLTATIENSLKRHVSCNYTPLKNFFFSLFRWQILKHTLVLFYVNKRRSISRLHYFAPSGNSEAVSVSRLRDQSTKSHLGVEIEWDVAEIVARTNMSACEWPLFISSSRFLGGSHPTIKASLCLQIIISIVTQEIMYAWGYLSKWTQCVTL